MAKHPDVDPNMWGVENADAKHGNHMTPRRLRYTLHNPEGRKPTLARRFTRRMMRGRRTAAAA